MVKAAKCGRSGTRLLFALYGLSKIMDGMDFIKSIGGKKPQRG
jgi:hypothetical protein